jgi:hypothetical protein
MNPISVLVGLEAMDVPRSIKSRIPSRGTGVA